MASLPPCLRTLWLSTCTVTPREARALSEQTQLRSLIIRFCDFVPGPSHSNSRQHSGGGLGNRRSSGEEDTLGEDPQLLVSTLDEFDIAARLTKLQELTVLRWEPSSANVCAISSLVHLTKLRTDNCLPFPSVSLPLAVDDDDTGSAADPLTGGSAAFQVAPQTGWGFLKRLTKLEHLAIGGYRFGHLSVECRLDALRQLSRLTNLLLRNVCSLDDDLWAWTARMPQLQILEIAGCSVTGHPEVPPADEDGRKPILQRLTLGGLQELTHVPACFHDLQFLELNNCHSLIQSSLRRVAHCTALRAVHFANCNVSDQGLSYLKALKNLQELDISKTMVQGEALKELQCAASLTSLEAFSTLQFDCQHLTRFSSLRRLSICHSTAVSDRTLVPVLSTLSQLTMLRLEHLPQISSQALCGVSRLPNLQTLWVMRNTGVDDGTMRHISCGLSGTLRWLDVSDCCLLTAAGLLQLRDMAALRLLEVARIPAVDKPLLQKLMEALPSCSIEA